MTPLAAADPAACPSTPVPAASAGSHDDHATAAAWRELAAGLLDEARRLLGVFQQQGDLQAFQGLAHLRRELAAILAGLPDAALAAAWPGPMQDLHAVLMDASLRQMPCTAEDEALIATLAEPVEAFDGLRAARLLMAPNARWPLPASPFDGEGGPLAERVLQDRFAAIEVHQRAGDAERAARYQIEWTDRVHRSAMAALGTRDHARALDLARRYAEQANLIQSYFCELNLRELFRQRGELLALHLSAAGLAPLDARTPRWRAQDGERIRLGVFAQQLGPGTENFFTIAHLEGLDRRRFDITLFTTASTGHPVEAVMRGQADRTVVLPGHAMGTLVQQIRAAELDVLLIGNNAAAVTNAAALLAQCRMAPLQIATVASPVSTGGGQVDVMLSADWNESSADAAEHHVERLERLEGSVNYYSYQHDHEAATLQPSRAAIGLRDDQLVLFSGANFFKLVPEQTAVWVRLLQQLPDAVLLLMPFNPNWATSYRRLPFLLRLHAQLREAGLAADRVRVLDPVPTRADVQACVALADVYLDPYPFSGACSLVDPLEAGVPPVVRRGQTGRSQHGASLMRLAGLEAWIADDEASYEAAVLRLARDPQARLDVREHLGRLRAEPAVGAPWTRTQAFSARVGQRLEQLVLSQRAAWRRLASQPPAGSAQQLQALADAAVERAELRVLTDLQIITSLVLPYFRSLPRAGSRHLLDVGACYGSLAAPFLAEGWSADLFEPDPRAREQAQRSLAPHASRFRLHAAAVSDRDQAAVPFHKASTDGLSGLSSTPFGHTEQTLEVPCERLDTFCRREGVGNVDFVKIDAEGHDFDALRSLDVNEQAPALILVEYGVHFARQAEPVVRTEIERMRNLGYEAVVFDCIDPDGQFQHGRWLHRLRRIVVGAAGQPDRLGFGNILFHRHDDRDFALALRALLESCVPAARRSA